MRLIDSGSMHDYYNEQVVKKLELAILPARELVGTASSKLHSDITGKCVVDGDKGAEVPT